MSKLDSLQNKLDMWQRICTMYGTNNLTLTPSDVVQLRQEVAVLYARIAELEKALNIDTDLTIAGLRKELRDATARIAELDAKVAEQKSFSQYQHLWQQGEDAKERAYFERLVPVLKSRIAELEAAQRWAPLEDPPKFDGRYLLRNIYGDVYSSKYVVKTETWVVHDFAMFTHWMPLPELPEVK